MRGFFRAAVLVLILALTIPYIVSAYMPLQDAYIALNVDESSFAFVIGTSSSYSVPNADLLYGFPDNIWSTHTVVKVDTVPYDLEYLKPSSDLVLGSNFITGKKNIGDIVITARWELVMNPATGPPARQDTVKYRVTLTNSNTLTAYTVALRLELDTKVIDNDVTNISIDNGFNVITSNTIYYKSSNQISSNWWDYDQLPVLSRLVGRGYLKNNRYEEAAVEPDIMEVANWVDVNGDTQWSLSTPGITIPPGPTPGETPEPNDSAVVLWWCNGDDISGGFVLNPGESRTFLTYYGINSEPVLTTPTATRTVTSTFTRTYTRTQTPSCTITPTYSITETHTITETYTDSPTITQTHTVTDTPTITQTSSVTPTITETSTFTDTPTVTPTFTVTPTITDTPTFTVTDTVTETSTMTATPTITPTYTPTPIPLLLELKGNFPNPFIIDTQIVYKLSVDADVKIKIFDVSGEIVRHQEDIAGKAGYNSFYWDGKNWRAKPVASGVYIYRVEASTNRGEHAAGVLKAACVK